MRVIKLEINVVSSRVRLMRQRATVVVRENARRRRRDLCFVVRLLCARRRFENPASLFWYVVKSKEEEEDNATKRERSPRHRHPRGQAMGSVATLEMEETMETATLRRSTRREKEEETTSWTWNCTWRRANRTWRTPCPSSSAERSQTCETD